MDEIIKKFKVKGPSIFKKIIIISLIVCLIIILSIPTIIKENGSYKNGENSNTPYTVDQFTNNVSIDKEGNIHTALTAEELWNKMIEEGCRVDEYLDGPEELKKLINAEMVTDYLDTRPNPNRNINWDNINEDIESATVQGIIKLKRAKSNGDIKTLKYTDPETFQKYIDNYNASGSERDKQKALSYFTLQKEYSTNVGIIYGSGNFKKYDDLTQEQLKQIANLCKQEQGTLKGAAAEASLMANLFELEGSSFGRGSNGLYNYVRNSGWFADATYFMDNGDASSDYVDVVEAVLVNGKRTLPGYIDEHDCLDDITSASNNGESIEINNRTQYQQHITKITNNKGVNYIFYSYPDSDSDSFGYKSEENRNTIGDFYYDFDTGEEVNKQGSNQSNNVIENSGSSGDTQNLQDVLVIGDSIAGSLKSNLENEGAKVIHKVGKNADYFLQNWDSKIANLSTPKAICLMLGQNLCGGGSSWVNSGISDIKQLVTKLKDKFPSAKIFINSVVPTIKNCSSYPNYMNDYNSVVEGLKEYCSKTNGVTYILTLDGYITDEGYAKDNVTSDGLHPNATGSNTLVQNIKAQMSGTSSSSSSSNSAINTFYAKVATWSETTEIVQSSDSSVEGYSNTTYTMTSTKVNYQEFVSGYRMPFDYLWALLVVSQDKEFVLELADLVYESEIEITVHDNLTETTTITTDSYEKEEKVVTDDIKINVSYIDLEQDDRNDWVAGPFGPKKGIVPETLPYQTVHTNIVKTNTLNVSITKAKVWIVDYTQEFTYEESSGEPVQSEPTTYDDEEYSDTPDVVDSIDTLGLARAEEQNVNNGYSQIYRNVHTSINSFTSEHYFRIINKSVNTSSTTNSWKYISSPSNLVEKVDKDADKDNFITILEDHNGAENNLTSASGILFDILEKGPNTVDMLDLTKYLLYIASGRDFGVTEFDFSIFDPKNFKKASGMYGGTIQEKIWFALLDLGYKKEAIAGVLGNLEAESGFKTNNLENQFESILGYTDESYTEAVNSGAYTLSQFISDHSSANCGAGYGLAQWTWNTRKQGLYNYAKHKGVDIDDENMQIEYLIGELTPGGGANGCANYQLSAYNGYTVDDWLNADSAYDAGIAFCWVFEKPGGSDHSDRGTNAEKWYNQLKDAQRPSSYGNVLVACEEVTQEFVNRGVHYSVQAGNLIYDDIERCYKDSDYICCATYVAMVLYRSGALTAEQINKYNYHWTGSGGIPDMLKAAGWYQVSPSEAQPGDVVNKYTVHALIYAGDGKCWDQTSCVYSSSGSAPSKSTRSYNLSGCQIWRAPNK